MPEKFQDRTDLIDRPKEVKSGSETDPNKPVDRLDTKSEQKREDFLKQNETLIDTLIKWLGDWRDAKEMKGELLAMIARESNFQVEAKSGTGSRGLMQLTTNPLKDMSFEPWVGRWDKYKEYFQKSAIACTEAGKQSKDFQKVLDGSPQYLKTLFRLSFDGSVGKNEQSEWNKAIKEATNDRSNPLTNIVIGSVYHAFLRDGVGGMDAKKEQTISDDIKGLSSSPTAMEALTSMLTSKWYQIQKSEIPNFLSQIEKNPAKMQDYLGYRKYNGDSNNRRGAPEKVLYASALSIATTLEQQHMNMTEQQNKQRDQRQSFARTAFQEQQQSQDEARQLLDSANFA